MTGSNCFLLSFFLWGFWLKALSQHSSGESDMIRMNSSFTSFPDTARSHGHIYDSVLYDAASHYSDNSVLIVVPKKWKPSKNPDLVFWFHGWRNNIDSSLSHFRLAEQFLGSNRNAILILSETAKNSPDSYGGKLEQPGMFSKLVMDIFSVLVQKKILPSGSIPGQIILAGHSGAYRVMARIVKNGGLPVCELQLFDALYAEEEIFEEWILSSRTHRFVNLYTDHGGTAENSVALMQKLQGDHAQFLFSEEVNMNEERLAGYQVFFIHSAHEHNDIIMQPDNFRFFLENSGCLRSR